MLNLGRTGDILRCAWDLLLRIPPLWILAFLMGAYSCVVAARQRRGRDALLLVTMLLSCVFCVVYLCVAGDVL